VGFWILGALAELPGLEEEYSRGVAFLQEKSSKQLDEDIEASDRPECSASNYTINNETTS
jgi:hypothetical protein